MLIDSDVSEWPREKVVSRHHTSKMSDDDLKHLHVNAGATLHVREVQLGNEAQISKTMLFSSSIIIAVDSASIADVHQPPKSSSHVLNTGLKESCPMQCVT
jgi:hypothetical protein